MQSQDVAPRPAPASASSAPGRTGAALVEHYPRLVRLAYLLLPPGAGRDRRVLTAHGLVQRALPRGRSASGTAIPAQAAARGDDPEYAYLRVQVVRAALAAGRPRRRATLPGRGQLPPLLPRVRGLRLSPHTPGPDELALGQKLSALSPAARAAYVLRGLEGLADADVRAVLSAAGVAQPDGALREAGREAAPEGLLEAAAFDPCLLLARPTDLVRRRQHLKAGLAAAAAVAVCGALLVLPGGGWGPDGAAAPAYAQNPAAEAALDPARLTSVAPSAWRTSARTDFSVWPARGELTSDTALLRRALAVWARPGSAVRVSATPGTASGGPAGPPQLLYAGDVDAARVVVLYDGQRIARYAEPKDGTAGAALDFARVDGASGAESEAVVLNRTDGNTRYLTAPWVTKAASVDLLKPAAGPAALALKDGVTAPLAGPAQTGDCTSWNALRLSGGLGTHVSTDLGELVPAHLTAGRPTATHEVSGSGDLASWSPYACSLASERGQGVRSVNAWEFAEQPLPDATGTASWVCTRAETWRGDGATALAQFHTPAGTYGALAAKGQDVPACGARDAQVLAGVLWKSKLGNWFLLAAGSRGTESLRATGGVTGSRQGRLLAVRTTKGAQAVLQGTLSDGRKVEGLK
ncbi:hypothetical protein [Streptomyces sp. NPDC008150]|uniref:hypothetical protein n=1 Tax=Streptomyces sp. NPDC008150 TaxID=3364816 RepID=UPI0036E43C03